MLYIFYINKQYEGIIPTTPSMHSPYDQNRQQDQTQQRKNENIQKF